MAGQQATLAQRIVGLRDAVTSATKLRAEAEASVNVSKQRLAEIDAKIRELGLNPDNADVELQALEAQLDQTVTELQAAIASEITTYRDIIAAGKAAFA
jgi:chromosome segregation ATPase